MRAPKKYEDLAGPIEEANEVSDTSLPGLPKVWIRATLRWLDRNPDQAPGRTITESRLWEISQLRAKAHGWDDRKLLEAAGVHIVSDPEPSNAEKWERFCKQLGIDLTPWQIDYLVAAMDERDVKAPEVADE